MEENVNLKIIYINLDGKYFFRLKNIENSKF